MQARVGLDYGDPPDVHDLIVANDKLGNGLQGLCIRAGVVE